MNLLDILFPKRKQEKEELKKSRARDKKSRNYFRIIWKN